jgi:branched chain amino acid efflux pump
MTIAWVTIGLLTVGTVGMTIAWVTIGLLTVGTVAIKAVGPIALGGRRLPDRLAGVVALLAPSLLAALVIVDTLGADQAFSVDERLAGLAAAGGALAARLPLVVVLVVAVGVTAGLRALS